MEINQVNNSQVLLTRQTDKAARLFASSLQGFENDAISARRGLQVVMSVSVFGMGTLLPNNLPKQELARPDMPRFAH